MTISDFKKHTSKMDVTIHCKSMEREKTEKKSGKFQFMAVVADSTSAVDCCVRNEKLYRLFKPDSSFILRKVKWNGKVLLVDREDTVTTACDVSVSKEVMKEAFGTGPPISIAKALALEENNWFSVIGKVVKVSNIHNKLMYKETKVLTHRQVRLQDDTEFMKISFWVKMAVKVKIGTVIKITACKKLARDEGSEMTTTKRSKIKVQSSELFPAIHVKKRYKKGTLKSISAETYQACVKANCYNCRLKQKAKSNDMTCMSCGDDFNKQPDNYAEATMYILTPKKNLNKHEVFWPQLKELFNLFDKKIEVCEGKERIESLFLELANEKKVVKYVACGSVNSFKL